MVAIGGQECGRNTAGQDGPVAGMEVGMATFKLMPHSDMPIQENANFTGNLMSVCEVPQMGMHRTCLGMVRPEGPMNECGLNLAMNPQAAYTAGLLQERNNSIGAASGLSQSIAIGHNLGRQNQFADLSNYQNNALFLEVPRRSVQLERAPPPNMTYCTMRSRPSSQRPLANQAMHFRADAPVNVTIKKKYVPGEPTICEQ